MIKLIGDIMIKGKWNLLTLSILVISSIGGINLGGSLFGISLGFGSAMGGNAFQQLFNALGILFLILLAICILCIILVSRHNVLAIITGILWIVLTIEGLFVTKSSMDSFGLGAYSTFATNQFLYSNILTIVFAILLIISGIIGIKYKKMINNK